MAQGAGKLKAAKTSGGRKNNGLTKKGKRNCAPKKAMASKEYMTKKVSVQFAELAELVWDRASGWNQTIELQMPLSARRQHRRTSTPGGATLDIPHASRSAVKLLENSKTAAVQ